MKSVCVCVRAQKTCLYLETGSFRPRSILSWGLYCTLAREGGGEGGEGFHMRRRRVRPHDRAQALLLLGSPSPAKSPQHLRRAQSLLPSVRFRNILECSSMQDNRDHPVFVDHAEH